MSRGGKLNRLRVTTGGEKKQDGQGEKKYKQIVEHREESLNESTAHVG